MSKYYLPDEFFGEERFDYDKIQAGLRVVLRQFPDDAFALHEAVRFAYLRRDRPTARKYWEQIKNSAVSRTPGAWSVSEFLAARSWLE